MPSFLEAVKGVYNGSVDILFLNEVLREYREVRKIYYYEYEGDDKAALQACGLDLRPLTYAVVPALTVFWGSGKLVPKPKRLFGAARGGLLLLRAMAGLESLRLGYLGIDCTQRLVSLQTPLGGEIVAIMRQRDPNHPLLRWERPPAELNEDGSRPRIASEANRLARIAQLRRELAQAKQGQAVDRGNEQADERLFQLMRHQQEVVGDIQHEGGPTAAANAGSLGGMQPQQAPSYRDGYQAAAGTGSGSLDGGETSPADKLDSPPPPPLYGKQAVGSNGMQRRVVHTYLDAMNEPEPSSTSGGERPQAGGAAVSNSEDPLAMLLGGGSDAWQGEEGGAGRGGAQSADSEAARQQRRRERRSRWWRSHGGRREEDG
ncbi:hypothetical protein ACK3TF_002352 [Chlorella vulgaris]